jgi:hypothetical protein
MADEFDHNDSVMHQIVIAAIDHYYESLLEDDHNCDICKSVEKFRSTIGGDSSVDVYLNLVKKKIGKVKDGISKG